ncbi:MAG: hypothetical protein KAU94_03850 [Verrucomicrobia bacterium]|nr:hypothetical protein [Verrucomicrobiota bacterium]
MIHRIPMGWPVVLLAGLFLLGCSEESQRSEFDADEIVSYSRSYRIKALDPALSGDVSSSKAISRIYEGLVEYDYLARPYKVVPLLTESMPEVSADGLVYTFKIRKGIHFHDDSCFSGGTGRELVAEDFIYSFKRIADVKNISSGFWIFDGRVLGINAFHEASKSTEPTDYGMEIEGLKALDRHTLQIRLTEPYPQLLNVLTMHYAFAVAHEAVEHYGPHFVSNPVGTGPYELVHWRRNSRIEFVRSPKWAETGRSETYPSNGTPEQIEAGLLKDAGEQIPFVDRVVQFVVDDGSTAWMMFLSGQFSFSEISPDNWDAVMTVDEGLNEGLEKRGISIVSAPTLELRYIGFNWEDAVLGTSTDPEVDRRHRKLRQALSCAYNFDQMNQFMNGRLYPANGPVPEPLGGSLKERAPYRFDLEKAMRLLAEAGYPEGIDPKTGRRLKLTMEVGGADPTTRQMMELLTAMFDRINVVLNVQYNTSPAFHEKLNRKRAQMFYLGWVADYPDAENFFQLFYSKNVTPGPNHANYRNTEIDRIYEQIQTMLDSPERTALYEKMAHIVVEDAPWIFCYQSQSFALKHSWIKNYTYHAFPYGMEKYQRANIDERTQWFKTHKDKKLSMSGEE